MASEGDLAYIDYGEIPQTVHTRILGAHVADDLWVIVTPDHDVYVMRRSYLLGIPMQCL